MRVLLAIVSPRGVESEALRSKLGLSDAEYRSILDSLQQEYIVDVVSYLDGERIHEALRLTDYGQSVLTSAMERICELPE